MEEQSRQVRFLVLIAAVLCAVIIGYNAFYVPDAPLTEPVVTVDRTVSSALFEEYTPSSTSRPASSGAKNEKVNINTATAEEISRKLKGIGSSLAEKILEYRKAHGPFRSTDQIRNVPGIGDKKYEAIRNFITVS